MCDKKILTPWPGHKEICNGFSHTYRDGKDNPLTPLMLGEDLDGTWRAPCPDYIWPKGCSVDCQKQAWELTAERETRRKRELVNEYFIRRRQTFGNYAAAFNGHQEDVAEIQKFLRAEHLKRLVLKGDVGRGKSHLAQACVNQHGHGAVMISSAKLYRLYRELEDFEPDKIAMIALDRLNAATMIAVDDLGVEKHTDAQVFNQNFKELLESFTGKLIITTNLAEKEMENIYGQKIVSRLYDDAVVIVLRGKDYRRTA